MPTRPHPLASTCRPRGPIPVITDEMGCTLAFSHVVVAIAYDDEADAVAIANDSDYGLAGAVYCADAEQGLDTARQIRTGTYGVNQYSMDFASPIGAFKASGIGRECGPEGLAGYVEYQSIIPGA